MSEFRTQHAYADKAGNTITEDQLKNPNDSCKNCLCKGDLNFCLTAPCHIHDSWFAKEMMKKANISIDKS